ncbi:hypothetical protein CEXT_706661 [Caerostris extrusa]|uniref:Uncharacterized protein n=1 Tax=Caerostris extrusa TaxID=172846 RepID=A0AAV4RPP8_CAEEX|nr:hypothetical protein CEXT_706661 [Caerostris extrusa]
MALFKIAQHPINASTPWSSRVKLKHYQLLTPALKRVYALEQWPKMGICFIKSFIQVQLCKRWRILIRSFRSKGPGCVSQLRVVGLNRIIP